ncbi:MAG: transglycosylase domain-containing protein [Desulfobacteraceae bacterium]|nr:transglycosylase domain-containing protein [Desulfobacteraceae bacterium]
MRLRPCHRVLLTLFAVILGSFVLLARRTGRDLRPLPASLKAVESEVRKPRVFDRNGVALSITYQNRWSTLTVPLHEIPELLQQAFVQSEDRRFFEHGGPDWLARAHALLQNIRAMRGVRGASTITEQVVRMLHPRPRTVWSRWIEGFEAARLEKIASKTEILEFYLNQVPYAQQRRGVVEAARLYFDRDLNTLNPREILALAVLVRAPSGLDLRKNPKAMEKSMARLAGHMIGAGLLDREEHARILSGRFELARPRGVLEAPHFVQYLFRSSGADPTLSGGRLTSTLDGHMQQKTRQILANRLEALRSSEVGNGAVLVVDNRTDDVLAWVSGSTAEDDTTGSINAVLVPRQPGSTLKPFLYALAMELGWTPATLIDDSPMAEPIGSGLHSFQNYSRVYYGPLRLRDALGNSLNTPAIRTIKFTGVERFLERLHLLGISGLTKGADHYGEGLALGDGEVNLFELVQAYAALARLGEFRPLRTLSEPRQSDGMSRQVIDRKTAAMVIDILSDSQARRLEFGEGHLLRFPIRTAVKTGTSTDHRDCWAVGFTDKFTVGVWMGNLDRRPTRGITGAIGPALVLRSVFAELNREHEVQEEHPGAPLITETICSVSGMLAGPQCPRVVEVFEPGNKPAGICAIHAANSETIPPRPRSAQKADLRLLQPTQGLQLAIDPRIPLPLQSFAFKIPRNTEVARIEWVLNRELLAQTGSGVHQLNWALLRGIHQLKARVWTKPDEEPMETPEVSFMVK